MDAPLEKRNHRGAAARSVGSLGPIADLEGHLPDEWWREIFDALYLMTDGDVVENDAATAAEVDYLIAETGLAKEARILDLCCGQGRHVLELARRGFSNLTGVDRSRYLVRLAKRRAQERKLGVTFREGDARRVRLPEGSEDVVMILGNSFGYFANEKDDAKVLNSVARVLRPGGTLVLDITDGEWMKSNFERRSWEWIDGAHFVCRERSLAADARRLVSREVIVHDQSGVIADQFYAERLYTEDEIKTLLKGCNYRDIRVHAQVHGQSDRGQDLGMMARRIFITATAPEKIRVAPKRGRGRDLAVAVLLGDPRLPDKVKLEGEFGEADLDTVARLKEALAELTGYDFRYIDNHAAMIAELGAKPTDLVLNLCDEGLNNDPFKELHVPSILEMEDFKYTGAGPASLGLCYDKALVRAVAKALDIPVPLETYIRASDQAATLPSTFPAILKPNFGDSSFGITKDAVVHTSEELVAYLEGMRRLTGDQPILVQEYLTGGEFTVGLIGNPETGLTAMPLLEVDYSGLDPELPRILGYESKWDPHSPYWSQIRYRPAVLPDAAQRALIEHSSRLFERLRCSDYARFDFRADADGTIKLLEANPNPGWCWDGKMNLMAEFAGWTYSGFLGRILDAAEERLGLRKFVGQPAAQGAETGA